MFNFKPRRRFVLLSIALAGLGALAAKFASGSLLPMRNPPLAVVLAAGVDQPSEVILAPYADSPLRTLKVKVGNQERPFLLDTGGGGTILSKTIAAGLNLEPFGRFTGFRHNGERADAPRAGPVKLTIGGFTRNGEVGLLDVDALFKGLPPVAGITSLETFAGQAITVDLAANQLWIETPESLASRTKDAPELQARIARQAGGAGLDVFVAIKGKHGPLWFEIDSGNVAPVLIAPHAFAELGLTAIPPEKPQNVTLEFLGLGRTTCLAASKELIYDGLLNAQFFMDHVVTFDLAKCRVWAKPREKK